MTKRRITCLCLAVLLLLPMLVTGCGKKTEKVLASYTENSGVLCETATVKMEGSKYELTWVKENERFVLKDTESGNEFYSTPEWKEERETCTPLIVDYFKPNAQNLSTLDGLTDCVDYYGSKIKTAQSKVETAQKQLEEAVGDEAKKQAEEELNKALEELQKAEEESNKKVYSVEQIENGFRATYSFPEAKIAVPVEYLLTTDGMIVRVPMDRLQESENKIYEIKLAPYFVSAVNDCTVIDEAGEEVPTDSYLMVPSGGGALIHAKRSGTVKEYYECVYGEDQMEPVTLQSRIQSQIYLPVFGATTVTTRDEGDDFNGDASDSGRQKIGMLGIIEEGADCAMVYAKTGGEDEMVNQFSCAYASFCIRSKEKVVYNSQGAQKSTGTRYSDTVTSAKNLAVRYIPMSEANGEDTTYIGMAKRYRQYLQERGYLKNTIPSAPALSVNVLGATQITESLFGVPYQSDVSVTTLAQAQDIVEELKKLVGDREMLVSLEGFGQGGLAHTEVGGGFKLSAQVGKQSDLDALIAFAKKNNITLSMDYELAQFQNAGNGVQLGQDTAMCISTLKAKISTYQMNTGLENDKGLSWYLLTRGQLSTMVDKAIAAVNKHNVGAISIGSLSSMVYSDFRTEGYAAKYGFSDDVSAMLNQCSDADLKVIASNANGYAALNADYVTEVPMKSTRFNILNQDIPFYTLVFQGYKPLTASSINLAVNIEKTYLQAVSTGMALQFTLCDTLHESIQFDEDTAFVSSRYADWKDRIAEMANESADLLAKVGNQPIKNYTVDGDLTITEFENGVVVYANYSDAAMTVEGVEIPSMGFHYVEG